MMGGRAGGTVARRVACGTHTPHLEPDRRRRALACLGILLCLPACHPDSTNGRVESLEAEVATLKAQVQAMQSSGVAYASSCGNADTLDGLHASQIAESGTFNPALAASDPGWQPQGVFSYLRTGNRVRVTGTLRREFGPPDVAPLLVLQIGLLPYRTSVFPATSEVVGTAAGSLNDGGMSIGTSWAVNASVGSNEVEIRLTYAAHPFYTDGTVSVDFSYDVG